MMMRASSFQFTHPGKGATRPRLFGRGRHPCFNSRTLGRVRLSNHGSARRYSVSIHAPWEGCDLRWSRSFLNIGLVSIHAPWEGCDHRISTWSTEVQGFNSRTLGRVRLIHLDGRVERLVFQFTHPGKGATVREPTLRCKGICFNSRTLGRVRHLSTRITSLLFQVSIHAPWEGCDFGIEIPYGRRSGFQFTHPGKGATAGGST